MLQMAVMNRLLARLRPRPVAPGRPSYSQSGEDLIADYALRELKIERPAYLDIGAHHPFELSNTYLFYTRGARGLLVEPDPANHAAFKYYRPFDELLGAGVGAKSGEADFYLMAIPTSNTFSKKDAEFSASAGGNRIERVVTLPVVGVNDLLEKYGRPNLVSLDVEGLDGEILDAWDFERHRPEVLIVESATYTHVRGGERKRGEIFERMRSCDYFVYGDTWINSVFVDRRVWDLT